MNILEQCKQDLQKARKEEAAEIKRIHRRHSQQTIHMLSTMLERPDLGHRGIASAEGGHVELYDLPGYLFSVSAMTLIMCRAEDKGDYDNGYCMVSYPRDIAAHIEMWESQKAIRDRQEEDYTSAWETLND